MKQIIRDIIMTSSLMGMIVVHIGGCYLLFGKTAAIVYGVFQVLLAIWMAYELIRAPVYDD